jgi:Ni,Fe-hydrogenase III small subunit
MITDSAYPSELQYKPEKIELDEKIAAAKAALLNDIKRSVYIYRCDLGGCNGCEIEIFATITPVFDAERFGIKNTPSPRHADILVYTGAVTRAMRMPGLRAYQAAPDPKLVVSYGACGCTGGIFHDNYCTWGGTDQLVPVDVYIPGCPPTPAQTIYGFAIALGKLGQKLKHKDEIETAAGNLQLAYADIPYKVRTALEREARLYSGYAMGYDLGDEFMRALNTNQDALANIDALIGAETDERKVEVFNHLRETLLEMVVAPGQELVGVNDDLKKVTSPIGSMNQVYGGIAGNVAHADSASEVAKFQAEHPELAKEPDAGAE